MSALQETAEVSEEESGSATEPLQRKSGHSNPVVSRTVEFQGMTRTNSEDGAPIATSSQTSDISGDEEEPCVEKADVNTLKLPKKKKGMSASDRSTLRKGKWTPEEEEYTSRIIHYFSTGLLILPEGYTLRSYLAEKLNCDPMRITKKYAGAACLGRRAYHYREHAPPTIGEIQLAKTQLDDLEHRFRMRVEEGYTGLPYSSTTAQNSTVPPQTHSSVTLTIDQMNSVLGLQNALHSLASNTRQHADIHNQIPTPASWNQSHAATMFQNQPIPSMPQQHPNAVEVAKLLLAQNQATPNLIPVLAQLLSTAGTPVIPSAAPYQVNNANSSAALLPILASILGSASVTPQAQAASNAIHLAPAPVVSQTSQNPAASMSLPQVSNAPTYANIPSHISQVVPPTYLEVNSQGNDQTSSNPFVDQLKNVYELHMSSLGQTSAPLSTHGIQNHQERRTQQPLAIASKPPREPFSSVSAQKQTPFSIPDRSSRQEDSNGGENQTDGSILVGFLSSLKESYLKALQTPDGEKVENGPRNTVGVGEPARVPTVTDTSSVSQHGSSTEEVDWNPDRRVNGHAGGEKRTIGISSKGPPRKRHKQKQQTRRD